MIGINLVGRRCHVVGTTGTHGLDRDHNALLFLLTDAPDLAINLFRRSHTAAGRVDVENDGLDGRVVAKFLELSDHRLRRKNYAVKIDYADAVAEAPNAGFATSCMQRKVDQREHRQHEEEKCSSAN